MQTDKEYISPLAHANVRDLGVRVLYPTHVRFNYPPPAAGKNGKLRKFRAMKEHVEFTGGILPVLDTHELYTILQGIQKGDVHWFWQDSITWLWNLKRTNMFLKQIVLDDGTLQIWFGDGESELPIIEYPENGRFVNHYETE